MNNAPQAVRRITGLECLKARHPTTDIGASLLVSSSSIRLASHYGANIGGGNVTDKLGANMATPMRNANFRLERKDRVEILGVLGAGKTTLAHRLAENQRLVLAENHDRNIFWNDQQAINALGYLPYDLSFLLQHAHLVASAGVTGSGCLFCDWSLLSDRLWASMRLGQQLAAYETVHRSVSDRIGQPLGYLYLKQPAEVIAARLVKRGRVAESAFSAQAAPNAADQLEALVQSLPPEQVLTVGEDVPLKFVRTWAARRKESAGTA